MAIESEKYMQMNRGKKQGRSLADLKNGTNLDVKTQASLALRTICAKRSVMGITKMPTFSEEKIK